MKHYIIALSSFLFVANIVLANDDQKKEKKAIIKTIKKEYVSWLARDYQEWMTANASNSSNTDSIKKAVASISLRNVQLTKNNLAYVPEPVVQANKLKDFKFQISHDQAVVKFMVDDYKMKSAFLEKQQDGEWKLLIVANQNPPF
jgi:hypothetical protein